MMLSVEVNNRQLMPPVAGFSEKELCMFCIQGQAVCIANIADIGSGAFCVPAACAGAGHKVRQVCRQVDTAHGAIHVISKVQGVPGCTESQVVHEAYADGAGDGAVWPHWRE
jgi:hypothetical protein